MEPFRRTAGLRALAVAGMLVTIATAAHAADVFNGCSSNRTQRLRGSSIVANTPAACHLSETPRTWSDGQPGPQGPAGPSDAFATYEEVGDSRGPIAVPLTGFVEIGHLTLPAGSYVTTASLYFANDSVDAGIAYCLLLVGDRNAQVIDSEDPGHAVSQALTVAADLPGGGTATLSCRNNGIGGNLTVQTFNLNAIKVGTLTFQ